MRDTHSHTHTHVVVYKVATHWQYTGYCAIMWLPFLHDYSRLLSLLRRRRPCHHLLTTRHTITSSTGITITHDMMTHCIILCTSQAPPTAAAPPVAPPSPPPSPSGIISMLSDCYVYIQKRLLFPPMIFNSMSCSSQKSYRSNFAPRNCNQGWFWK